MPSLRTDPVKFEITTTTAPGSSSRFLSAHSQHMPSMTSRDYDNALVNRAVNPLATYGYVHGEHTLTPASTGAEPMLTENNRSGPQRQLWLARHHPRPQHRRQSVQHMLTQR